MKFDVEKNLKIAGFFITVTHFRKISSLVGIGEKATVNLTPKT